MRLTLIFTGLCAAALHSQAIAGQGVPTRVLRAVLPLQAVPASLQPPNYAPIIDPYPRTITSDVLADDTLWPDFLQAAIVTAHAELHRGTPLPQVQKSVSQAYKRRLLSLLRASIAAEQLAPGWLIAVGGSGGMKDGLHFGSDLDLAVFSGQNEADLSAAVDRVNAHTRWNAAPLIQPAWPSRKGTLTTHQKLILKHWWKRGLLFADEQGRHEWNTHVLPTLAPRDARSMTDELSDDEAIRQGLEANRHDPFDDGIDLKYLVRGTYLMLYSWLAEIHPQPADAWNAVGICARAGKINAQEQETLLALYAHYFLSRMNRTARKLGMEQIPTPGRVADFIPVLERMAARVLKPLPVP